MPGIAIKYWAFEQNGWGHVVEEPPVIPPAPEPPATQDRSDYQEWIGTSGSLIQNVRKPIFYIEPRILTTLHLYTYSSEKYELQVRTQENLRVATDSSSWIECKNYSILSTGQVSDYLSVGMSERRLLSSGHPWVYASAPKTRYIHQEVLNFHDKRLGTLREATHTPNLPMLISVKTRERHENRVRSAIPIPLHVRTPLLEYVQWHAQSFPPHDMSDDQLLETLAQIILYIEENQEDTDG